MCTTPPGFTLNSTVFVFSDETAATTARNTIPSNILVEESALLLALGAILPLNVGGLLETTRRLLPDIFLALRDVKRKMSTVGVHR